MHHLKDESNKSNILSLNKNIKNVISNAEKYWHSDFNEEKEIEYLFEGKIEIIDIL